MSPLSVGPGDVLDFKRIIESDVINGEQVISFIIIIVCNLFKHIIKLLIIVCVSLHKFVLLR